MSHPSFPKTSILAILVFSMLLLLLVSAQGSVTAAGPAGRAHAPAVSTQTLPNEGVPGAGAIAGGPVPPSTDPVIAGEVQLPVAPTSTESAAFGDVHPVMASTRTGSDNSTTDPSGDLESLTWLYPTPKRDFDAWGSEPYVRIPSWIIGNPTEFYWRAFSAQTFPPPDPLQVMDRLPESTVIHWSSGAPSSGSDDLDYQLSGPYDLTGAEVGPREADHIRFNWRLRDPIPRDVNFAGHYDFLLWDGVNADWNWQVGVSQYQLDSWWYVHALASSFPWHSTAYEDILSADASWIDRDQLQLEMTLAASVPSVPAASEGLPGFAWLFDIDGDPNTGGDFGGLGADMDVFVSYDPAVSAWVGQLNEWSSDRFVTVGSAAVSRAGAKVTAQINALALPFKATYRWSTITQVYVQQANEWFYSNHLDDTAIVEASMPPFIHTFTDKLGIVPEIGADLCPEKEIVHQVGFWAEAAASGLDRVRLTYTLGGEAPVTLERVFAGETDEVADFVLGPFQHGGTVTYHIEAQDRAGKVARAPLAGEYSLKVLACTGCSSSWVPGFSTQSNGLRFANFSNESFAGGVCSGMSATSIDYLEYQKPWPADNHWVAPAGADPKNDLSCYVSNRMLGLNPAGLGYVLDRWKRVAGKAVTNLQEFGTIRDRIAEGRAAFVGLGVSNGHALTVYAATECDDGRRALFAYDSNRVSPSYGALPSVEVGQLTADRKGLELTSTSTRSDEGTAYTTLYALFAGMSSVLPIEPVLGGCSSDDLDRAAGEVSAAGYRGDSMTVVTSSLVLGESAGYPFAHESGQHSAVIASWPSATVQISIFRPDETLYDQQTGQGSPLVVPVAPDEPTGVWRYEVTLVNLAGTAQADANSVDVISMIGSPNRHVFLPMMAR
jgi:hypothetical protein